MKCPHCGEHIRVDDDGHYAKADAKPTANQRSGLGRRGTIRRRLMRFIADRGALGATDDEAIVNLAVGHQSLGPRRLELQELGYVIDSGLRRRTRTHKEAIVWVATSDGLAELQGRFNLVPAPATGGTGGRPASPRGPSDG